jgi:hypothetical protein
VRRRHANAPGEHDNVTFPPGRESLATKPNPTGSPTKSITIGMVDVARFASRVVSPTAQTMTSTFSCTNSAAKEGKRSESPYAVRSTSTTSRPSTYPLSLSAFRKASLHLSGQGLPRKVFRSAAAIRTARHSILVIALRFHRPRPVRQDRERTLGGKIVEALCQLSL